MPSSTPIQMDLARKKVLVVGLGKSGVAAALFLRSRGALVTVSEARSEESLAKELPALLDAGIMVEAGGHGLLTFRRQDLIVVSPGVPTSNPELAQAQGISVRRLASEQFVSLVLDYDQAQPLLAQLADEREDFSFAFWIEVGSRFVQHDYAWAQC